MLFQLFAITAVAASAVAFQSHVLHERREAVPESWAKRDRVHGNATLPMRIGMTQSNLQVGHDLLMDMYVGSTNS